MQFFEYPYVIITSLSIVFIVMGLIGLYFTIKSIKTANGTVDKSFCSIGKIENDFDKTNTKRKNRCVLYVSMSLENMEKFYSESRAARMYQEIKNILLMRFGRDEDSDIAVYGKWDFVALNNVESKELEKNIEKCIQDINEALFKNGAVNVARINFGYHSTASTEVSFKTALSRARQACSMAEEKGISFCEWDSANGKEFELKIKIENNIQSEIENNKFFLEYQPILDAKDDKIIGAEVLSRLNSNTEGILTPNTFLTAVNNVGLNQEFDYYIFEKSCKWISSDKENRMKHVYTINFSRYTLCDEKFAKKIVEIVEKYDISFSCIAIEILEDKGLSESERTMMTENLVNLKNKGILILLDDFGKGYANFTDLTDFDIDIVKIDKVITQKAENEAGFLVLKNIIKTAHDLGFKTLCEGIETEEIKKVAVAAGCDMLQGYYFYRPMPVTQLEALLEN